MVVSWAWGICWYVCSKPEAWRMVVFKSGKLWMHMLQMLCNTFIDIVTTLVCWMPQVIVTLVSLCEVISTNYLLLMHYSYVVKGLSTYTDLLCSDSTLYIKPDATTVTLHCGLTLELHHLWIKHLSTNYVQNLHTWDIFQLYPSFQGYISVVSLLCLLIHPRIYRDT